MLDTGMENVGLNRVEDAVDEFITVKYIGFDDVKSTFVFEDRNGFIYEIVDYQLGYADELNVGDVVSVYEGLEFEYGYGFIPF